MSPSWNPESYSGNPTVRNFLQDLIQLAEEYTQHVYLSEGRTGLMIKDRETNNAFVEYWPEPGARQHHLFARAHSLGNIHVPQGLVDDFISDIKLYGKPVRDAGIFIDHLRNIFDHLYSESQKADSFHRSDRTLNIDSESHGFDLPKREDYDNARRKLLREGRTAISIEDMLDLIKVNAESGRKRLAANWRLVTVENILIWSGNRFR